MPQARPSRAPDARARKSLAALRAAMLALLETHRFEDITARQICAKAGIGYATFFRHFPDKEHLLSDVASGEITDLIGHAAGLMFQADTRGSTRALCAFVAGHRALWTTLLTGGAAPLVRAELLAQARALAQSAAPSPAGIPKDLAVVFACSAVLEILTWWLGEAGDRALHDVARYLERLAIAPIMSNG